jgi:Na+/melibiose symporter-like transporter
MGLAMLGVLMMPQGSLPLAAMSMIIAGVPFAAPAFLLRAMLADLNDAQKLDRRDRGEDGAETTGLNFAILTATQKLGYAIPVGLTYPLLALIGFDPTPGARNGPEALLGLELLFALPSAALTLGAAATVWRWPITAECHADIRARLAAA